MRELENLIERAVVLCRGEVITTEDPTSFTCERENPRSSEGIHQKEKGLSDSLEEIEKELILKALQQHQGVQTKAAESLRISGRVLRYKMKKYALRQA